MSITGQTYSIVLIDRNRSAIRIQPSDIVEALSEKHSGCIVYAPGSTYKMLLMSYLLCHKASLAVLSVIPRVLLEMILYPPHKIGPFMFDRDLRVMVEGEWTFYLDYPPDIQIMLQREMFGGKILTRYPSVSVDNVPGGQKWLNSLLTGDIWASRPLRLGVWRGRYLETFEVREEKPGEYLHPLIDRMALWLLLSAGAYLPFESEPSFYMIRYPFFRLEKKSGIISAAKVVVQCYARLAAEILNPMHILYDRNVSESSFGISRIIQMTRINGRWAGFPLHIVNEEDLQATDPQSILDISPIARAAAVSVFRELVLAELSRLTEANPGIEHLLVLGDLLKVVHSLSNLYPADGLISASAFRVESPGEIPARIRKTNTLSVQLGLIGSGTSDEDLRVYLSSPDGWVSDITRFVINN